MCLPMTIWPYLNMTLEDRPPVVKRGKKKTGKKKTESPPYPWHLLPESKRRRRGKTDHDASLNEYYRNYYQTYYAQCSLNQAAYNHWQSSHWPISQNPAWSYPQGWPIDQNKAKEAKKNENTDDVEYVGHYVAYGQTPTIAEGMDSDGKYHYNFFGRSKEQTAEDMHKHAHENEAWKPQDMEPKGAHPNQQFWVLHSSYPSGRNLLPFAAIKGFKGCWKIDSRHGNPYFIREEESTGN